MGVYIGKTFKDVRIYLDGNVYRNCKFTDCELVYSAVLSCEFGGNAIMGSTRFVFEGAAGHTLQFLEGMAKQMGARHIVEQITRQILGDETPGPEVTGLKH